MFIANQIDLEDAFFASICDETFIAMLFTGSNEAHDIVFAYIGA